MPGVPWTLEKSAGGGVPAGTSTGSASSTGLAGAGGLPSSQANGNSFPAGARDGNGLLWIPTSAGLAGARGTIRRHTEKCHPTVT